MCNYSVRIFDNYEIMVDDGMKFKVERCESFMWPLPQSCVCVCVCVVLLPQVRVSKEQEHLLTAPQGLSFTEVTAANLVSRASRP